MQSTPPSGVTAVADAPVQRRNSRRTTATALFAAATVLAGTLGPMQSAVNGQLGTWLGDGHAAALISFGTGLVLMFVIVFSRKRTREQALAIPTIIKERRLPRWNFLAGLCGAVIVLSEGVSVGALGVATFQISLISGMVISGVVCDRLGVGVALKQPLSLPRVAGAVLAVASTVIVISPNFEAPHLIAFAILPFVGGLLAGWQPAGNSNVAHATGSMLVSIGWNFLVGFTALLIAYLVRAAASGVDFALPGTWWMYLGGPLGLLSIALMALLVRGLGLLLLGLCSTAGQLIGSVMIDAFVPALGHTVYAVTLVGTLVALVAAGIAMIPSRRAVATDDVVA
ncbi:DMT family transporter [Georgenia sp. SYP-B2076]|uniref:DMT family transporter n=1 Tax=Georgenia sp. SYP-B2076 TaxID=2495881 RepID=UPI000F8D4919|nr:DMT family transporter [Georgenia sp. SYP-B2076]